MECCCNECESLILGSGSWQKPELWVKVGNQWQNAMREVGKKGPDLYIGNQLLILSFSITC